MGRRRPPDQDSALTLFAMEMPKTFAHKLAYLQSRAWLPPALLLLALSSAFIFGAERRNYFYRGLPHYELSAKNMAIAENLSFTHHFLMFQTQTIDAEGRLAYVPYNRFPIGSYALTKLAILPFGDDLSTKIYAARTLMLLFFAAAALMAYLSLRRITSSRWIALTAALLAFSSPHFLYYNDAIAGEVIVDLFGALLVFHGMAVFEQEGRFRQLLLKTCIALLFGWHVYALLLPFIALGLMRELIRARSDVSAFPNAARSIRTVALPLIRSRYLTLGVFALLFGVSALTINFTNEYFAMNHEIPPTELPSFRSMIDRTGFTTKEPPSYLSWPEFPMRQFYRIGAMFLPYAFTPPSVSFIDKIHRGAQLLPLAILGMAALGASLVGLLFIKRHKILLASLTLSGFCWALPMRHSAAVPIHNFEAIFYIGVTLALFSLVLLLLRQLSGERIIAALSVIALLVFIGSALRMSQLNNPQQTAELHKTATIDFEDLRRLTDKGTIAQLNNPIFHKAAIADFQNIRSMTNHGNLIQTAAIPGAVEWILTISYYLTGRIHIPAHETAPTARTPDFVVSGIRIDGLASLTPQNQLAFLYQWEDYHTHIDEIIDAQTNEPLARHGFDVYLNNNTLIYAKDACRENDITEEFFLRLYPARESDLPNARKPHGFDDLDFRFQDRAVRRGERCIAIAPLPNYDIARIYTGQYIQRPDSTARQWAVQLIDGELSRIDELIEQAGDPIIRSDFEAYLNDNALMYVKDGCGVADTETPFFLALYTVDESDLSAESRQHGFDNLDFRFEDRAVRRGERCIAVVPLPNYVIARIYTGQYIQQTDGSFELLWGDEFNLPNRLTYDQLRRINETIAQAGEPIIRSDFDVYLNDKTLIYVNHDCRIRYTKAAFFLAPYPTDENDLPAGARQHGFENHDFGFHESAFRGSDERCIAITQLPEYDIARIHTGQYIQLPDGSFEHIWEGDARLTKTAR